MAWVSRTSSRPFVGAAPERTCLGIVTIGIGLLLLALSSWITRKMRGVR